MNRKHHQSKPISRNTKNYLSLPHNPNLKKRAQALRKSRNKAEVIFWNEVKRGKIFGLDFDRQKIIGNYIVDFYCANCNLVVEIDGSSHVGKEEYDEQRDAFLHSLGLKVIHFPAWQVVKQTDHVIKSLKHDIPYYYKKAA